MEQNAHLDSSFHEIEPLYQYRKASKNFIQKHSISNLPLVAFLFSALHFLQQTQIDDEQEVSFFAFY